MPATEPEQLHGLFEQAFNAGDVEALMALYEPDAALIPQPGALAEGTAAIRDSLRWFLDRRAGSRSTQSSSFVSAIWRSSRTAGRSPAARCRTGARPSSVPPQPRWPACSRTAPGSTSSTTHGATRPPLRDLRRVAHQREPVSVPA